MILFELLLGVIVSESKSVILYFVTAAGDISCSSSDLWGNIDYAMWSALMEFVNYGPRRGGEVMQLVL